MANLPEFPPGWHCYLLLCAPGSYYCGITSNLADRIRDHASGKGSGYTKKVKPIALSGVNLIKAAAVPPAVSGKSRPGARKRNAR